MKRNVLWGGRRGTEYADLDYDVIRSAEAVEATSLESLKLA
ncbi:MAG TPA: hypothetical protein VFH29_01955 [Anaerolineales bacterium]|nr:hypothetical protein [Anaerolineales bacterium]